MLIDYVRVYQRPDVGKMGCDPADHPTAAYIASHANAYANPNLTTWAAAGYTFPVSSRSLWLYLPVVAFRRFVEVADLQKNSLKGC